MALDQAHPELSAEQAYIDAAYAFMDAMYAAVESFGDHGRNDFEKEAFRRWKAMRLAVLSDRFTPLVFGRIDRAAGDERFYIGRQHIYGDEHNTVVVDWRAPVAQAFYRADSTDHMGLRRRRHFLLDARELLGIADDELSSRARLRGEDVLQAELSRRRTGVMRDIVATIQAEQDRIIRAPLQGSVVVQGGPGTGKTAIGLHRASFLLYEHREYLSRYKVLVVGPNQTFLKYIAQVLPSLGETSVIQRTLIEMTPLAAIEHVDSPAVARIKGDARMAVVLERALAARAGSLDGDVIVQLQGSRIVLAGDHVDAEVRRLRAMDVPYGRGRTMLRDALLMHAYRTYQSVLREGSLASSFEDVERVVRADRGFRALVDTVWPSVGVKALVGSVIRNPARFADGVLTVEEQEVLTKGARAARGKTTHADRVLMDEAAALIEGEHERYGHVVVDEAQDLTPMEARLVARRCREGSMTVLGDIGQATGAWVYDDWEALMSHLPGSPVLEELTLGYRVGRSIMDVARRVLAAAAPNVRAPESVRTDAGDVTFTRARDLGPAVLEESRSLVEQEGSVAVIVADALEDALTEALSALDVHRAEREGLTNQVTIVPASQAKGLEFDAVIVAEPAVIVAQGGLRLLYICITRAMRALSIVHVVDLPEALRAPVEAVSA